MSYESTYIVCIQVLCYLLCIDFIYYFRGSLWVLFTFTIRVVSWLNVTFPEYTSIIKHQNLHENQSDIIQICFILRLLLSSFIVLSNNIVIVKFYYDITKLVKLINLVLTKMITGYLTMMRKRL